MSLGTVDVVAEAISVGVAEPGDLMVMYGSTTFFLLVTEAAVPAEILVLGCGARAVFVPPDLRAALKAAGLGLEVVDTGSACRIYNVLLAESRRVAAALIPL